MGGFMGVTPPEMKKSLRLLHFCFRLHFVSTFKTAGIIPEGML
jgi:hypothetical protein